MKFQKNLIEYKGVGDYQEWAKAVYNSGFNYSINDVSEILDVSTNWIRTVLLLPENKVHYVVYNSGFIKKLTEEGKTTSRCNLYLNLDSVGDYIKNKGKFEVQTEIIDLYSYLYNANKNKARIALKMYQDLFIKGDFGTNKGTIPYKVLDYINENYYSTIKRRSLSFTRRGEVMWKEIKPFNIFEHDFYLPKDKTRETVYRQAFLKGDIKVTLGARKTIFIKNNKNIEKMKMPMLIPYGETIIVKNK